MSPACMLHTLYAFGTWMTVTYEIGGALNANPIRNRRQLIIRSSCFAELLLAAQVGYGFVPWMRICALDTRRIDKRPQTIAGALSMDLQTWKYSVLFAMLLHS